ncbi:MAG: NAD+ synthase [Chromatiales bacterium]|nr:NAD+ synthase [Chromatiales bacterium]
MRVVVAQCDLMVGDVAGNAAIVLREAARALAEHAADLVVFPELTLTGYPPEDLLLKPEIVAQVDAALARICAEAAAIGILLGYPRRSANEMFNSAALIRDGRIVAIYDKHVLPNYAVFDEKRYFAAGQTPCVVECAGVRIGITICEDIWTEAPARLAAAAGAELLINLNASPFHTGKFAERLAVVDRRRRETGLPVVYGNLVGGQDELVFDGSSFAIDRDGELVARAAFCASAQLIVDVNDRGNPQSGDIAPLPERLESIYGALVLGTRDYVRKNGFHGAVLGLSGGIDSALVAAIAADALGAEQVLAVMMPTRYTADISVTDAAACAAALGIEHRVIPIEPVFRSFVDLLAETFGDRSPDTTEENIQARCRGVILMALSNKFGHILLTTGNKSEMAVGYATLYGDMAGGYAPIKDIPKTLVYALAEWRNARGTVIPRRIIERAPSAELRADQTDQDSLPPYDLLDAVLERYIERDESVAEIIEAGFDTATVRRIARLVDRNEYKRRQAPPGVRISRRAFGRDRRYPLTSGFRSRGSQ